MRQARDHHEQHTHDGYRSLTDTRQRFFRVQHTRYIEDTYRRQNRGGKGIKGMGTKETDFVENLLITTTHHTILFFTTRGRVYSLKAYEIAESSRTAKGTAIINLLQLDQGEKITAVIQVKGFDPDRYLFMATRKGIVKKTSLSEFSNLRKNGLNAINLDDDDDLMGVKFTDGESYLMLGTKLGNAIAFSEDDVRAMGRMARGVKGISLADGDEVVGMDSNGNDYAQDCKQYGPFDINFGDAHFLTYYPPVT